MNPWTDLVRKPDRLTDQSVADWFAQIADHFLNRTHWIVAGSPHRPVEVEFYYRHPRHPDPFTHGDPFQVHAGRWYFHKTAGVYRGGSFKGADVTFGDGEAQAGMLFRGLETPDGKFIDGPSILVDHLLRLCRKTTVAELDLAIAERLAWETSSPLHFVDAPNRRAAVLATARVGLSLRRARPGSIMPQYLTRPYRFLTEPAAIAKGKIQMVMGLHRAGRTPEEIRQTTGSPQPTIARYIAAYQAGLRAGEFEDYFGMELKPLDLCRLHGIADRT